MDYFKNLATLLELELAHDRAAHELVLASRTLTERKELGVTWYPIQISDSELGRGDYLTVTFHKTNDLENGHRFRFGMPISLFSNYAPQEDRIQGTIAFVNQNLMKVSFRTEELPDWSRKGKLGLDLLFDENSYREMKSALQEAERGIEDPQKGKLTRKLLGLEPIALADGRDDFDDVGLNISQNDAVRRILGKGDLAILHGPPGTGKTTTLIKAIAAGIKRSGGQVLIVAPSNTAVDVLAERLDQLGLNVLRIGNPVKVSAHLLALTVDEKASKHAGYKEVKGLEKQARAYTDMARKYKRNFGRSEYEQRKALLNEARKIRKDIDRIQDYVIEDILCKAQVIAATLVGANHPHIRDKRFETVVIDEAAQGLEPACWIPILKADRLLLAGDHCQLPPTIKSEERESKELFNTLFEKLVKRYPDSVSFLDTQYRMNSQIMTYSSVMMYDGRLKAAPATAEWRLVDDTEPIVFIDTAGAGFEEKEEEGALSNKEEADFLVNHLSALIAQLEGGHHGEKLPTVGVITPYRGQANRLKGLLSDIGGLPYVDLQVSTVDGFQGQEKDIIYISLVRSNTGGNIGFLSDVRRINVALTRAKKKLVVIGDSSTIGQHAFYKGFLDYVESVNGYHSVWEWNNV
ncbi:AAA domain-containing protein [Sphingobacterium tabacisoli]|uniref:AAA domain-containing protein n=1 Tax=Sphingobacterium tabacisoli TaxID=2044855 RepID=A0ABW5L6Q4_9SPHI|nr:AAA domain-containing protein [Sphingobacterium tabacisoli]